MYVRFQGVRRDAGGAILAGTGSIIRTVYDPDASGGWHSRQKVVERLGRVVWTDNAEGRVGKAIFVSPLRGLVEYDQDAGTFSEVDATDPRIAGTRVENYDRSHVELGPAWVFLLLLARTPVLTIMRRAFGPMYQRVLAHVAHGCLAPGDTRGCGSWLDHSALSWVMPELPRSTLDCDTAYFVKMGDDRVKTAFFGVLVQEMRKISPDFGRCCYVDSTPLPGEAKDNPFNELSSHGTDGAVVQSRLVLVLDAPTGIPVWHVVIPPDVLDKSTEEHVREDVEATLCVRIDEMDLDAGYACRELFAAFNRGNATYVDEGGATRNHTVLVRMPQLDYYPFDELYVEAKPHFHEDAHQFDHDDHSYFGMRFERDVLDHPEFVHVLLDHDRALDLGRRWRQENPDDFAKLSRLDREWYRVKDGLFMLVGNADVPPERALAEYLDRAKIESFFKEPKSYLRALPIAKWSKEAVLGKVLNDVVETIAYRALRLEMRGTKVPVNRVLADLGSVECARLEDDIAGVLTSKRQARQELADLGIVVPGHMDLSELRALAMEGIAPDPIPLAARKKAAGRKPKPIRHSPEEKARRKEEAKAAREAEKERKRQEKREAAKAAKSTKTTRASKTTKGRKPTGATEETGKETDGKAAEGGTEMP